MNVPVFNMDKASAWLSRTDQRERLLYASVDFRRGGGRICPVDVNLFPAGFNNLCAVDTQTAVTRLSSALARRGLKPGASVGVVAESHTRNPYYAEHLHALVGLIRRAGYRVEAACPECAEDVHVRSASGEVLNLMSMRNDQSKLIFGADFLPDFILLNNDLSAGVPDVLRQVSQPMEPPPDLGWHVRRKHRFFEIFADIAQAFCEDLGLDPRMIVPMSIRVADVDFKSRHGLERIAVAVETVLSEIRRWNEERGIPEQPTAVIKSNYGTYGMAVMSVTDASEVVHINRKAINKMHVGKGKVTTTEVLVQEGIPTDDTVNDCPAEPVVYLIEGEPVGAFYRHHCERGNKYNLNVSGMAFEPICLSDGIPSDAIQAVSVVARVAALAAAQEISGPA